MMTWIAYCRTCGEKIEEQPNGAWVEVTAKVHTEKNHNHCVLVGYEVTWVPAAGTERKEEGT
jgi:hypothetical protein